MTLHAEALARILLLQNMISQFADQKSIFSFVCRGLEEIPGVNKATYLTERSNNSTDQNNAYFPLQLNNSLYGEICISLSCQDDFKPYQLYISNLCFMVAVILEERRQNQLINQQQQLLEQQVNERTKELEMEVQERRVAEERALQAKKRAELYLDISEAIIVELDRFGKIRVINKQGCEILGHKQSDLLGKEWIELCIPLHIQPAVQKVFNKVISGQGKLDEYLENEIVCSNGKQHLIAWHNVLQFDDKEQISGVISSGIDITQRKQAEDERLELERQLKQAQKIESIGQLAAGIAHDFNNLLSVIINNLELQQFKQQSGAPFDKNLAQIRQTSTQAKDLVAQILTFSRQEKSTLVAADLSTIVSDALKFLRPMIPSTVELMTVVSAEPLPIHADTTQLQQVLINLCNNAVHAMHEKGLLQIRLEEEELTAKTLPQSSKQPPGRYAKLSITDTGEGMDEETLNRIFDPFFTTKEVGVGTGLGLSVVHGVVEQHDGVILVDSTPGQGSTFTLYFPITSDDGVVEEATVEAALPTGTERILLVDDEECVAESCGALLEDPLGYQVTVMTDSVAALDYFKAHPQDFDLVITDQTMPKLSGVELAKELLNIRPELPVILCSGYSAKVSEDVARDLGISAFCMKPLLMDQLALVVRDVLDKSKQFSITG